MTYAPHAPGHVHNNTRMPHHSPVIYSNILLTSTDVTDVLTFRASARALQPSSSKRFPAEHSGNTIRLYNHVSKTPFRQEHMDTRPWNGPEARTLRGLSPALGTGPVRSAHDLCPARPCHVHNNTRMPHHSPVIYSNIQLIFTDVTDVFTFRASARALQPST